LFVLFLFFLLLSVTSLSPDIGELFQVIDGTISKGSTINWQANGNTLVSSMSGQVIYSLHAKGVVDNLDVERVALNYLLSDGLHNTTSVLYLDIRPGIQLPLTFSNSNFLVFH